VKGKNSRQVIDCVLKIREKYKCEGKLRGTDEYCKKKYGHLNANELRAVWKKLKEQRRKARISPAENIAGEVDEGMFMDEESWVEDRLAQLQKERTAAMEKEVFGKEK
jgi:hypothetical protein